MKTGSSKLDDMRLSRKLWLTVLGPLLALLLVPRISAASSEQHRSVAQIVQAVAQVDQATRQNAALVEQSAAATASLQGQAEQLVQAVAIFQ